MEGPKARDALCAALRGLISAAETGCRLCRVVGHLGWGTLEPWSLGSFFGARKSLGVGWGWVRGVGPWASCKAFWSLLILIGTLLQGLRGWFLLLVFLCFPKRQILHSCQKWTGYTSWTLIIRDFTRGEKVSASQEAMIDIWQTCCRDQKGLYFQRLNHTYKLPLLGYNRLNLGFPGLRLKWIRHASRHAKTNQMEMAEWLNKFIYQAEAWTANWNWKRWPAWCWGL